MDTLRTFNVTLFTAGLILDVTRLFTRLHLNVPQVAGYLLLCLGIGLTLRRLPAPQRRAAFFVTLIVSLISSFMRGGAGLLISVLCEVVLICLLLDPPERWKRRLEDLGRTVRTTFARGVMGSPAPLR